MSFNIWKISLVTTSTTFAELRMKGAENSLAELEAKLRKPFQERSHHVESAHLERMSETAPEFVKLNVALAHVQWVANTLM